uniref:Uncharacterized protein n=1 Tax=Timema bartmani TaxID=61472 RepID=A0A7R9F8M1_9NEOP|nr:unnamed protein product [Timema bartmani]
MDVEVEVVSPGDALIPSSARLNLCSFLLGWPHGLRLHSRVGLNCRRQEDRDLNPDRSSVDEDICREECCYGLCFVRSYEQLFKKTEKKKRWWALTVVQNSCPEDAGEE